MPAQCGDASNRCPRCRAEDVAADAHPARALSNGVEIRVFVCRRYYRPTELEYGSLARPRARDLTAPTRDALRALHDFYTDGSPSGTLLTS